MRAANSILELTVAGRGATPGTAASTFLNVTAVDPAGAGYLTVYPCGQTQPNASNVNFAAGQNVPNAVISKIGTGGKVCIFTSAATQLIVDTAGYFPTTTSFTPLANPVRLLDSRTGGSTIDGQAAGIGPRPGGQVYTLQVAGRGGLPGAGSLASAVLNVTVDAPASGGYITVYPCDQAQPNASNVNFQAGQTIPGLVVAKLSAAGTVCVFTDQTTDLLVDAAGYFATTVSYTPLAAPVRFMETRNGAIAPPDGGAYGEGARPGGTEYQLLVGGRNGIAQSASAVLLNVTVAGPQQSGYLSVYPCGSPAPNASNLNYEAGKTIANTVPAGVGAGRKVCIFVSGTTDVIVDVAGRLA